jgi:hypothetical protein
MKICPTLRVSLPKPKALGVAVALACSGVAALAGDSSVLITDFSYVSSAGTLTWLDPFQSFQTTALNGGGLFGSKSDSFETDDYNIRDRRGQRIERAGRDLDGRRRRRSLRRQRRRSRRTHRARLRTRAPRSRTSRVRSRCRNPAP